MKEASRREDEAAAKSGTFTSARLAGQASYDPRELAKTPSQAPTIGPKKFFKNKELADGRKRKLASICRGSWLERSKPKPQYRVNKKESAKKKARTIKLPTPDDKLPPLSFVSPRVPFSNGNCSSAISSKKVAPPSSRLNGNISPDADVKQPSGKSPDQLIDLSDCDDQEPRSGFVLPHQVGFQVFLSSAHQFVEI